MFFNLNAEMGRAKLTIKKLSEITAINYESLKLNITVRQSRQSGVARATCPD